MGFINRRLVAGGIVALAALGSVAAWWLQSPEQRVRTRYADFHQCLLGPPLEAGQSAEQRLRRIHIAVDVSQPRVDWPARCAYELAALRAELTPRTSLLLGKTSPLCGDAASCLAAKRLRRQLALAKTFVSKGRLATFEPDVMLAHASELNLVAEASEVRAPPRPAKLLNPNRMRALYRGNYLRLLADPGGDRQIDLLFYEEQRRYQRCSLRFDQPEMVRCRRLPTNIPVSLAGEVLAATEGAPAMMYAQGFVGGQWREAVFDMANGRLVAPVAGRPAGGFVWSKDAWARLEEGEASTEWALHRHREGAAEPPVPLALPGPATLTPRLLYDEVVWTVAAGSGRHRVYLQRVLPGSEALGPLVAHGTTPSLVGPPGVTMCRHRDTLMILVGGQTTAGQAGGLIVFRDAAGLTSAVPVRLNARRFGFTCDAGGATFSSIRSLEERAVGKASSDGAALARPVHGRYQVQRMRCRADGCRDARAVVSLTRYSETSRYVAGSAGDQMVVLWRSALGDIRSRMAPLEQLAQSDAQPLFDDLEHGGFGWDLERDPIFGRDGNVLVLVSRQVGTSSDSATYGFLLDPKGHMQPVGAAAAPAGRGAL